MSGLCRIGLHRWKWSAPEWAMKNSLLGIGYWVQRRTCARCERRQTWMA